MSQMDEARMAGEERHMYESARRRGPPRSRAAEIAAPAAQRAPARNAALCRILAASNAWWQHLDDSRSLTEDVARGSPATAPPGGDSTRPGRS